MSVAGAKIAATLMQLGLIDDYRLYVHPVFLGGDKPMFGPLRDRSPCGTLKPAPSVKASSSEIPACRRVLMWGRRLNGSALLR